MIKFKLFNTLEKKKVVFEPIDNNDVRIYACGPTVYNYAHVGNARMAVICDLLVKALKVKYSKVTYISNITDIDDKIILAAKKSKKSIKEITEKFSKIYNDDMATLGVTKPDKQPKATDHINDMIKLIKKLIDNGNAYEKESHVLFHVPSYKPYGTLSKRTTEELIAGSRIEVTPFKKYPGDFILWKPSFNNEPGWSSPWGFGRPGWHIECSTMSEKCLGLPFDIHAGGIDLAFPHHENEIAQSCSSIKKDSEPEAFAKYWFHNGFVLSDGEKMSKSLGNIKLVNDLVKKYPGETIRLALMTSHYRQPLNWTEKILKQSYRVLDKFYRILRDTKGLEKKLESENKYPDDIVEVLFDDLNTPKALSLLNKKMNELAKSNNNSSSYLRQKLINIGKVLGLLNINPEVWLGFKPNDKTIDPELIDSLIKKRNIARVSKNFQEADKIRDKLKILGIEIEDNNTGTKWRKL